MDRARRHAYHGASAAPLYRHVALRLETAIRDGHIVPGGELGNEILLAARFEVSRATMRRAILELVDKGLLVRRRGVGTPGESSKCQPPYPQSSAAAAPEEITNE